jgi:hypothetical protein
MTIWRWVFILYGYKIYEYVSEWSSSLDCEWTLAVEGNGTRMVLLTFLDFGLEIGSHCGFDYLEVGAFFT